MTKLIFNLIHQFQPNLTNIKWAAQEISNEYCRPYKANFDKLLTKIQQIHKTKWQTWQSLDLTAPAKKNATQFRSPEIQFLRRNANLFETFQIEFHTKKITPSLKPLASYVVYFLQINAVTHLNRYGLHGYANYCDGYDWNVNYYSNLEDFIGRRLFFIFQKNAVKKRDLFDKINSEIARLLKDGLAQKMSDFLQNMSMKDCVFGNDELFEFSGFIAGGRYFKKFATPENIEKISKQIEFIVEIEKS